MSPRSRVTSRTYRLAAMTGMSGLPVGLALIALVAAAGIACGTSSVTSHDGEGNGGASAGGGGGSDGGGSGGGGGGGSGNGGGGAGATGGGGSGGSGGSGTSGCATSPIGCGSTQVCVAADCTREAAQCMPITCVPNSNCCQAAVPCTVDGGTGCASPIRACIDQVPTPVCASIGAGCSGAPTCACLPSNICPAGQVCVGVSAARVVACAAP